MKRFLGARVRSVLEVTDTHVRFAQTRMQGGKYCLSVLEEQNLQGQDDAALRAWVLSRIKSHKVDPACFLMVVPRRTAMIRRLRLPSLDPAELHNMVALQVGALLPYAPEELVYEYETVAQEPSGYSCLIVYLIQKNVIERLFGLCNGARCHPSHFILSSAGLLEWYLLAKSRSRVRGQEPVLVLRIDIANVELCFIQGDQLLYSRVFSVGEKFSAGTNMQVVLDQVGQSLALYQKEAYGASVAGILVFAPAQDMKDFCDALSTMSDLPVEILEAQDVVSEDLLRGADKLPALSGGEWIVCLGLLCTFSPRLVSLVTGNIRQQLHVRMQRRSMLWFVGALAFLLFMIISFVMMELQHYRGIYLSFEKRLQAMEPDVRAARNNSALESQVQSYLRERVVLSSIIVRLYQALPSDINLRSINVERTGHIVLGGYAGSGASVNLFQSRLVEIPEFIDVTLQFTSNRRVRNLDLIEFRIRFKTLGGQGL